MRLLGVSDFVLSLIQKGEVLNLKMFTPFQTGLRAWGDQTAVLRCLERRACRFAPQSEARGQALASDREAAVAGGD